MSCCQSFRRLCGWSALCFLMNVWLCRLCCGSLVGDGRFCLSCCCRRRDRDKQEQAERRVCLTTDIRVVFFLSQRGEVRESLSNFQTFILMSLRWKFGFPTVGMPVKIHLHLGHPDFERVDFWATGFFSWRLFFNLELSWVGVFFALPTHWSGVIYISEHCFSKKAFFVDA